MTSDLASRGMTRQRVVALVVRLLDESLVRVGNAEYEADNETYGLTTLRRRFADLPIVLLTGDTEVGEAGDDVNVVLAKPFKIDELEATIQRLLAAGH